MKFTLIIKNKWGTFVTLGKVRGLNYSNGYVTQLVALEKDNNGEYLYYNLDLITGVDYIIICIFHYNEISYNKIQGILKMVKACGNEKLKIITGW